MGSATLASSGNLALLHQHMGNQARALPLYRRSLELYRQGFGGVRLEDLVLVTDDGHENLTRFSYELQP